MSEFTKGKWKATGVTGARMQSYSQPHGVVSSDGRFMIAGCFGDTEGGVDAAEANARLIAAAPTLLAALELVRSWASDTGAMDGDARDELTWQAIVSAIAAARGEE